MNNKFNPLDIMVTIKAIKQDNGNIIPIGSKGEVVKRFSNTILGDDVYVIKIDGENVLAEYGVDIQLDTQILPLEVETHLCRDCGHEMTLDMQEVRNAPDLAIVTCKNKSCTLYSVTLSTDVYAALTEAQVQEYRQMVSNLKRTLGMRS